MQLLMAPFPLLDPKQYARMIEGAKVLERDLHGDKVLALADGSYLKLFRRKRLISSAAWYPYAQRFADNAETLAQRNIPCPQVIGVFRIPEISRDAVHYWPLAGQTLRQLVQSGKGTDDLRRQLFDFVDHIHAAGVFFRSLHLGNIVLTPEGQFGLIDIADMRIQKRPLFAYQRRRNLNHLLRDGADGVWLQAADPATRSGLHCR